jgi:hypothetical protein
VAESSLMTMKYFSKTHLQPADILTIIQLSDIHHEPDYLPDGNAVCNAPMCCRSDQGPPANPSAAAGYWGDYRDCDTPWNAFNDTVQQIKRTHQVRNLQSDTR